MCGLAGLVHWGSVADASVRVGRMMDALRHRGPDDRALAEFGDVTLGFTRLAIVDLAGGRQPMSDRAGELCVIFNGEITNHRQLRRELEAAGHVFVSDHSDTEVLIHGYRAWGLGLVPKLNGMFAFALWDSRSRELVLARDRYGIKPLYVARMSGHRLLLGSEVKGLLAAGLIASEVQPDALYEYLNLQNCWDGRTPFRGIDLFPPGHFARVGPHGMSVQQYWDYPVERSRDVGLAEAAAEHRALLLDVIGRNIDADVPVASYLSGGIDSTAITAAASRLDHAVRSYSCIFNLDAVGEDASVDEREFSRHTAAALALNHTELTLQPDAIVDALEGTMRALEYPRMGVSYENYLIAGRVAREVKVVLSGMGGEEIHGGYVGRYQLLDPGLTVPARPARLRSLAARLCRRFAPRAVDHHAAGVDKIVAMLNVPLRQPLLDAGLEEGFRAELAPLDCAARIRAAVAAAPGQRLWDKLYYLDAKHYLHGLLVLEDKLSMAHSLETRVPLLDNELVDYVSSLPWPLLIDGGVGKLVFRHSVRPWVPESVFLKPKMGFGPPEASWYRTHLSGWLRARLSRQRIARRGLFKPEFVERILEEHLAGRANHVALLWSLLSIDSWCSVFGFYGGRFIEEI